MQNEKKSKVPRPLQMLYQVTLSNIVVPTSVCLVEIQLIISFQINECSTRYFTDVTSKEECIWEEHKDVYSSGAKLYIKAINIEACKTACIHEIADCVAIDYHSSSLCWYHANNTNLDSKRQSVPGKNLIQYVRVCSLLKEEQQYSTL